MKVKAQFTRAETECILRVIKPGRVIGHRLMEACQREGFEFPYSPAGFRKRLDNNIASKVIPGFSRVRQFGQCILMYAVPDQTMREETRTAVDSMVQFTAEEVECIKKVIQPGRVIGHKLMDACKRAGIKFPYGVESFQNRLLENTKSQVIPGLTRGYDAAGAWGWMYTAPEEKEEIKEEIPEPSESSDGSIAEKLAENRRALKAIRQSIKEMVETEKLLVEHVRKLNEAFIAEINEELNS